MITDGIAHDGRVESRFYSLSRLNYHATADSQADDLRIPQPEALNHDE